MADERKSHNWFQTIPGFLTAGAAFIAAVTGFIVGLNQTGLLDRVKTPPQQVIGSTRGVDSGVDSPPDERPSSERSRSEQPGGDPSTSDPNPATPSRPGVDPDAGVAEPARRRPPAARPTPGRPETTARRTEPAPASGGVLPSGTVLELAAGSRVCSTTHEEGDEFTATLVIPVTGSNGAALPVGTTAVLQILRPPAPTFIGARLEAIERGGERYSAGSSNARPQREFVAGPGERGVGVGACIPAGGRITVTLRVPIELDSS